MKIYTFKTYDLWLRLIFHYSWFIWLFGFHTFVGQNLPSNSPKLRQLQDFHSLGKCYATTLEFGRFQLHNWSRGILKHTCGESPLNVIESHYSGTVLWWFLNVTEPGLCLVISLQVQTLRSWLDNLNLGSCARKKAVFFVWSSYLFKCCNVWDPLIVLESGSCIAKSTKNVELQPSSTWAYYIKANCQGCGHWFLTYGSQGRMTLAQGRLGRAWMSLTSSLSGCHFEEESAKGASGLNWSCKGLVYALWIMWIFDNICSTVYHARMHLHIASHQSFGVLRCCCCKPLFLLIDPVKVPQKSAFVSTTSGPGERLPRVQVWKQTAWMVIRLGWPLLHTVDCVTEIGTTQVGVLPVLLCRCLWKAKEREGGRL